MIRFWKGEKNMKQIEAFVDEVYHGVGGNEKEIKELKLRTLIMLEAGVATRIGLIYHVCFP